MAKYVFRDPESMFHWIDKMALRLLSVPRDKFGTWKIEITQSVLGVDYDWIIEPTDKDKWKKRFEDEKR